MEIDPHEAGVTGKTDTSSQMVVLFLLPPLKE